MASVRELAGTDDPMVIQAVEYGLRAGYIVPKGAVPDQHKVSAHEIVREDVKSDGAERFYRWTCSCGETCRWNRSQVVAFRLWLAHTKEAERET